MGRMGGWATCYFQLMQKPPKNRQVFFSAYLHHRVKPLNQTFNNLSATTRGVNDGMKDYNQKKFFFGGGEKKMGQNLFLFVMLHDFFCKTRFHKSKLVPSSVGCHNPR